MTQCGGLTSAQPWPTVRSETRRQRSDELAMPTYVAKRSDSAHARLLRFVTEDCKPGDRLAPEAELSQWLGVSRPSLREVLADLAATGVIERRWGVGTFVGDSSQAAVAHLEELAPLTDIISRQGHSADVRLLGTAQRLGPSEAHKALRVADSTTLWELTRLYYVDTVPAIYVTDHVPQIINGTAFEPGLLKTDLLPLLESRHGVRVNTATTTFQPAGATASILTALSLGPADLLLAIHQTAYDSATNTPIIYTYSVSNPAIFTYTIVRRKRRQWQASSRPARPEE